jgi:uncharacterized coiled-coil protein SlyX
MAIYSDQEDPNHVMWNKQNEMEDNNELKEIIATLDRIIAMQDRMIEKLNGVNNTMNELNEYISSKNNMVERWDTTGPR